MILGRHGKGKGETREGKGCCRVDKDAGALCFSGGVECLGLCNAAQERGSSAGSVSYLSAAAWVVLPWPRPGTGQPSSGYRKSTASQTDMSAKS